MNSNWDSLQGVKRHLLTNEICSILHRLGVSWKASEGIEKFDERTSSDPFHEGTSSDQFQE